MMTRVSFVILAGIGAFVAADAVFASDPPRFAASDYCLTDRELSCGDRPVIVVSPVIDGGSVALTGDLRTMGTLVPVDADVASDAVLECLTGFGASGVPGDGSEALYASLTAVSVCA